MLPGIGISVVEWDEAWARGRPDKGKGTRAPRPKDVDLISFVATFAGNANVG